MGAKKEPPNMMKSETNDSAAAIAKPGATVAPENTASNKAAIRKKGAPKGRKTAEGAKLANQAKPVQKP
jgi:hypothetical protein